MAYHSGPLIRQINITPIAVADPPLLNAAGLHAPYALRTIVEIITDDQISGVSEIPGNAEINSALESVRNLVIGHDPFQLNKIRSRLEKYFGNEKSDLRGETPWDQRTGVHVFSAIEVACLDIIGKITDRPVADILGGKMRDRVPFAAYLFYKYEGAGGSLEFGIDPDVTDWPAARQKSAQNPEEIIKQAKKMCDVFGFQSIKLKGGVYKPEIETATIKALRDAFGPEIPLRLDPNGVWSVESAIQYGKQLEGLLEYLEDPVREQQNMSLVKKSLRSPLATNMCTTGFEDLPGAVALKSEDIILCDHHFWGGLRASLELSRICQTFNRSISMHSNSHLGISLAAMIHLGAVLPELPYALDTHYPWQFDEVIIGGKLPIEGGYADVPNGPGLGVELDYEALKRLHQNYLDCGLTKRDDEHEMQKVVPGWKFKSVRW
jgi:glucarate dehydratase